MYFRNVYKSFHKVKNGTSEPDRKSEYIVY